MKRVLQVTSILGFILTIAIGCNNNISLDNSAPRLAPDSAFSSYWYDGLAEISSYNLSQSRYGEAREGKAVLIFVTEPFSKSKQVKLDDPSAAGMDEMTVLKLNFTKNFITGIYPYSMMLSAFTPVETRDYVHSPKITMSSQEWCGQAFSQLNLQEDGFKVSSYSYFEREGDTEVMLPKVLLEDEIWNKIRLNYMDLPIGEAVVLPGFFHTRLVHEMQKAESIVASLEASGEEATYSITYPHNGRKLSIRFGTSHPYHILGWEEVVTDGQGNEHTTTATLDQRLKIDYWRRNHNADLHWRDSLALSQ